MYRVDQPNVGLDPNLAEILDEGRVMRLKGRLIEQEFDRENFAVRQEPLAVLDGKPCPLQQLLRFT